MRCSRRRRRTASPRRRSTPRGVPSGHSPAVELVDERVLGRQHHVGRAEHRVGPGREDPRSRVARRHREVDQRALAAADPVALYQLDRLGPVEDVQVVDQAVGVRRDAHHPLRQRSLEHREVAEVAATVARHLLVGQHRAQAGAPVHRRVVEVREPERVDDAPPLDVVELRPVAAAGNGRVFPLRTRRSARRSDGRDRPSCRTRS